MIKGIDIRKLRNQLNMSVEDFASLIGVHMMTVYKWETTKIKPSGLYQRALSALKTNKNRAIEALSELRELGS